MIPEFPNFKNLEISDKKNIEKYTATFPHYSDFVFFSMWGWDINNKMLVSDLYGNLVVLFNDYISGEYFLSFIGDKKILETTAELINFSKKTYGKNFLRLIPEEIILKYKGSSFSVKADRDSYDYIYLVEHLASMHTWSQNTGGRGIKKFIKNHPNYKVRVECVENISQNSYKELFERWSKNKNTAGAFDSNEYKAFERFLQIKDKGVKFISIYVRNIIAGFSLYEILSDGYAIAHFSKADTKNYPGIYDLLNWEEAKFFHKEGAKYLNWEQDLGIPGIRYSKEKYQPSFLMRKFIVSQE